MVIAGGAADFAATEGGADILASATGAASSACVPLALPCGLIDLIFARASAAAVAAVGGFATAVAAAEAAAGFATTR